MGELMFCYTSVSFLMDQHEVGGEHGAGLGVGDHVWDVRCRHLCRSCGIRFSLYPLTKSRPLASDAGGRLFLFFN